MISAALKHADVSCWGRTWLHIKTLSVRLQVQIWAPARSATPQIRADVQEQYELPSAHYITWGASIRSRKAPSHSWHFINRICLRLSWHSRRSDDKPKFWGGDKITYSWHLQKDLFISSSFIHVLLLASVYAGWSHIVQTAHSDTSYFYIYVDLFNVIAADAALISK